MNRQCVIGLTVRDCEKYLDKIFQNIEKLDNFFEDVHIIFFYDRSKDKTLEKLNSFKEKYEDRLIIIENSNKQLSKYRTIRIAYGRNTIKKYIDNHFPNYDYFIIMDADDVCCGDLRIDIIKKYIENTNWDSLSFNRKPNEDYYDSWALSIYPCVIHYLKYIDAHRECVFIKDLLKKRLNKLKEGELLEVYSAFAGFAIYRNKKFKNCYYDGTKQFNLPKEIINKAISQRILFKMHYKIKTNLIENCEHRSFHIQAILKNKAKIRITKDYLFD